MVAGLEASPCSEVNVVATLHRDLMSGSDERFRPREAARLFNAHRLRKDRHSRTAFLMGRSAPSLSFP